MKQELKKTQKSAFDNSWYAPGASKLKIIIWYYINAVFFCNHLFPFISLKVFWLKLFGCKVGKRLYIKPGVNIKYPWNIEFGNYVSVGENVWLDSLGKIVFQDHSTISQGAIILTGNHNFKKSSFDLVVQPVIIEEGVWIGAKAIVCPGIVCKSHSVLTVGSVATKDLEPYFIYSGNPAKMLKERVIE